MTSKTDALQALDSMDDLCRMDCGVDPIGPRKTLQAFIEGATQPQAYPMEEKMLRGLLGDMADIMEACEGMVCGGAITSLFTGKEVNDFDLYFRDEVGYSKFLAAVLSGDYGFNKFAHITDRSLLVTNHQDTPAQAITYKFFPEVQDVFNDFDFTVNMGAYDFKTKQFVFGEDFFRHNSQRFIGINTGTAYPLISVLRVDKYRQRGYTTSKSQLLRLLLRVSQLELNSWDDVVDHIGGMYGIDPTKLFDRSKEFSLDEVIDQLSNIRSLETKNYVQGVEFGDFLENCKGKVTKTLYDLLESHGRFQFSYYHKEKDKLMDILEDNSDETPAPAPASVVSLRAQPVPEIDTF